MTDVAIASKLILGNKKKKDHQYQPIQESSSASADIQQIVVAPEFEQDYDVEQRVIIVHVTFLKIGEINTVNEKFESDVLIRATWRDVAFDDKSAEDCEDIDWSEHWDPKIYIDNTVGEPKVTQSRAVVHNDKKEAYVTERRRVKGSFIEQLELVDFPFDVQDLSITIMSDLPSSEVELKEDPNEVHKIYKQSFIDEQEWYLYKYIESEKKEALKDKADPTIRRSALTVRCRAARRPAYFLWNIFSVTFIICCLAMLTFAVEANLIQNRLQLGFTLVLTSVAFKFVVNQNLPRISYLTYLDRYVLATIVFLTLICFWHGMQTLIPKSRELDITSVTLFGVGYLIYNIQFFMRLALGPYRTRREMKEKEADYVDTVKQQAMEKQATITKPKQKRRIWSVPKGLGKSPLTKRQSSAPAKLATPTSPASPTTPGDDLTSVKTVK